MGIVDTASSGSGSFLQTLQLLADPEEVQRRFQALVEQQAKTEKLLALVGPANEILTMRRQIEEDLAAAKVALGEARMQAGMLVDDARRKVQAIETEIAAKQKAADEEVASILAETTTAREAARATQAELKRLQAEYQGKLADVDNAKTQLEHEQEALRAARVAFENRMHALTDIVEQFRGALGTV